MELAIWEKGLKQTLPNLESFLKTLLIKKPQANIVRSDIKTTGDVAELLKDGEVILKCVDSNFQVEILIALKGEWVTTLSREILGQEQQGLNEVTVDLIKEFGTQLVGTISATFSNFGIKIEIDDLEVLKPGLVKRALNLQEYFLTEIKLDGKFDVDGDEGSDLNIIMAISQPNKKMVEHTMKELGMDESQWSRDELKGDDLAITDSENNTAQDNQDTKNNVKVVEERIGSSAADGSPKSVQGHKVEFEEFDRNKIVQNEMEVRNIDLLKDIEMDLSVELGRKNVSLGRILKMVKGSVIELDKLAGEPVEILVNGYPIAQGEVVIIDEHFGVRVSNLVSTQERIKGLG